MKDVFFIKKIAFNKSIMNINININNKYSFHLVFLFCIYYLKKKINCLKYYIS